MMRLILLLLLLFPIIPAYAQTAGVVASPNLTVTGSSSKGFGFSGGLFYDQTFYKKMGVSTGITYTQLRVSDRNVACLTSPDIPCPERVDNRFDMIELPIEATFKGLPTDAKWQFHLKAGYAFGAILGKRKIAYFQQETNKTSQEIGSLSLPGFRSHTHIVRMGFEVSRDISQNINLAIGARYKYAGIYNQVYGGFNNYNFFVKTGYRFQTNK